MAAWLACLAMAIFLPGELETSEAIASSNESLPLVVKIRRQLMEDNYDYQPSDEDAPTTALYDNGTRHDTTRRDTTRRDNTGPDTTRRDTTLGDDSTQREDHNETALNKNDIVSKKDLLYHVDIDGGGLGRRMGDLRSEYATLPPRSQSDEATPRSTYKIIKRRSGGGEARLVAARAGGGGVVGWRLLGLDSAPVPQFRLPRSRHFVDVLKNNLRKNNDDYAESSSTVATQSAATIHFQDGSLHYTKVPIQSGLNNSSVENNKRRSFNNIGGDDINNRAFQDVGKKGSSIDMASNTVPSKDTIKPTQGYLPNEEAMLRTNDGDQSNKLKMMESFFDGNQEKLSAFLTKKPSEMMVTAPGSDTKRKWYSPGENAERHPRARDSPGEFPATDQLDMAPARGGAVHSLRLKGRLCQRSVLQPEGPKYDARGRAYLRAFQHPGGRDFGRTRRPRLLLPRCCNCCSKSVLGCQ